MPNLLIQTIQQQYIVVMCVSAGLVDVLYLGPHNPYETAVGFHLLSDAFWNVVLKPDLLKDLFIQ